MKAVDVTAVGDHFAGPGIKNLILFSYAKNFGSGRREGAYVNEVEVSRVSRKEPNFASPHYFTRFTHACPKMSAKRRGSVFLSRR